MTKGFIMEKSLKIMASEISVVRVVCKDCKAAMDVPLERLPAASLICPGCRKEFRRPDVENGLRDLANSLQLFQKHKELDLQFVFPFDG